MRHALMIAAILSFLGGVSATADTLRTDINGRCRTPDGRVIRPDACKPQKEPSDGVRHLYMRNAEGVCHDEKGKAASPASCRR
jgi:hypothetical protein